MVKPEKREKKREEEYERKVDDELEAVERQKMRKAQVVAAEIDVVQAKRLLPKLKPVRKKVVKRVVRKTTGRDIGIDVVPPATKCKDPHCPFHGTLPVRGQILAGTVISDKMDRSVVVLREYLRYISKYERYERRTRKYIAHKPDCIKLEVGDKVRIMECRPLSKTKSFVVIEHVA
jgi:small subunit ribosomal protein S17